MATPLYQTRGADTTTVEPYTMHVSSRYLELTRKKLELTRMPRELPLSENDKWTMGTSKSALEPLIDYWLGSYDWRAQESYFNSTLHQYRTVIQHPPPLIRSTSTKDDIDIEAVAADTAPDSESLRIHFLHHRSESTTAIPLLYCHSWPGCFLELSRCIDALISPTQATLRQSRSGEAYRDGVTFHVVAPSVPGFGFSDASQQKEFGLGASADMFVSLMERLGYERFVVWGDGWGFKVARMIAIRHHTKVAAVYTSHAPDLPAPQLTIHRDAWFKYQVAKFTGARFPWLSFGYASSDFGATDMNIADGSGGVQHAKATQRNNGDIELGVHGHVDIDPSENRNKRSLVPWNFPTAAITKRPQTLAYGLCDSPAGLLAVILDALKPSVTYTVPASASQRTQPRRRSATTLQHRMSTIVENAPLLPTFTPADVLNWAMMYWLPGPEAGFRWLRAVANEKCYTEYVEVPLGISWYSSTTPEHIAEHSVRGTSSTEYLASFSRLVTGKRGMDRNSRAAAYEDGATVGSPMWATAVQNVKWIKRRKERLESGVPAWERSIEVVQDIREYFEAGRNEGWLGL